MREGSGLISALRSGDRWRVRIPALKLVTVVTLYMSTQMFFQPHLLEYWTVGEVASAWLEDFLELAAVAGSMSLAYALMQGPGRRLPPAAWPALMALSLISAALAVLLAAAALRNHLAVPPDLGLALATALRYGLVGSFLVLAEALWNSTQAIDALVQSERAAADQLALEGRRMRRNLLRAQIEPHFLFNTLAALRRLYRTEPQCAAQTMASLQRYLRAALPDLRREDATLTSELELVSAYLELMAVRMGARLSHSVDDDSGLGDTTFPPLVILTLVENAIKHGIEPARDGGRVDVRSTRLPTGALRVEVRDTGVGLAEAPAGGTGLGLANIRSRLAGRYGSAARLRLMTASPGVLASVEISAPAIV